MKEPSEEKLRVRLGPVATAFLDQKKPFGKASPGQVLDKALMELLAGQDNERGGEFDGMIKTQLEMMNANLYSIRHMLLALAANSDDRIQDVVRKLNEVLDRQQVVHSQEADLKTPKMEQMAERLLRENQQTAVPIDEQEPHEMER